ncbi:putative armadillo-like helical protein [Plasmopara halstedii]
MNFESKLRIVSIQFSHNKTKQTSSMLMTDASADSRVTARRLRRQYPQSIAQLDHHYHHMHQRLSTSRHQMCPKSHHIADGPPCLVSSRSLTCAVSDTSPRLPSKLELRRSEASKVQTCLTRDCEPMSVPKFRRSGTVKVSKKTIRDGLSHCSRRHKVYDEDSSDRKEQSTPYEDWKRLRRARTSSGNSCASTSSTSSYASYVVNPTTERQDFEPGSDDELNEREKKNFKHMGHRDMEVGLPSVLKHIFAPVLPPPPYPVDSYHFYTKSKQTYSGAGTAAEATSTLAALFTGCKIEAIFHPLKCKFKCLKYVHYSHVEFVVRVYAHRQTFLVEFQRRSGSMLLWDGLYRILYQRLAPIIDTTALPCSQSSGQKRIASKIMASSGVTSAFNHHSEQLCSSDHEGLGTQLWRTLSLKKPTPSSGVEAMKIMLTSRFLDAMREGCAGLAELTEDVQNSCMVAQADMVMPLIQAAKAADLNMSRCAIGALANIARAIPRFPENELSLARRIAQQLREEATPVILRRLEDADECSLFSIELLRECARALGAFVRLVLEVDPRDAVSSSINDERCLRMFRLHAKHHDAQLASHCRAELEQLRRIVK